MNRYHCWLVAGMCVALAGCQTAPIARDSQPGLTREAQVSVPVIQRDGLPAEAQIWQLLGDKSRVRILVHREGRLARFGHNHVVEVRGLTGEIVLSPRDTGGQEKPYRFDLQFLVKNLIVDRPEVRRQQGGDFARPLSESAIAGTRDNMLSEAVLDALRFPQIRLSAAGRHYQTGLNTILVSIDLHGVERAVDVAMQLTITENRLRATGKLKIKQSDFGITPFSVMFGALRVKDEVDVYFELVAQRSLAQ